METIYNIDEHIHRYASWAAARAASVSRFSNKEIGSFIEAIELKNKLEEIQRQEITSKEYKEWFTRQVQHLKEKMELHKSKDEKIFRRISFGIAAKVISIYVKTAEVIPTKGLSAISKVAYPPVDSYLLKGLKIKSKAWSGLKKNEFLELIDYLEKIKGDQPFWKLEFYWDLNN
ncbi:MAG: hypothetical protein ACTHJN_08885 [Ginsengibacter sp.]